MTGWSFRVAGPINQHRPVACGQRLIVGEYRRLVRSTLTASSRFSIAGGDYLRTSVVIVFFHTSLWAIKLSFLICFQRLGQNEKIQKIV
jgi:hypothetical protein